jgi:hypothetical protein
LQSGDLNEIVSGITRRLCAQDRACGGEVKINLTVSEPRFELILASKRCEGRNRNLRTAEGLRPSRYCDCGGKGAPPLWEGNCNGYLS